MKKTLFCAWLAWSRYRVVLPIRDKTLPSVFAALDVVLRRLGGAPTYVLTDNEKTVTVEHVAGLPVRNPQTVAFARHYGLVVHTCEPADPASKGGSENTVKLAKADLVPTAANLRAAYASFAELEQACAVFCEQVAGLSSIAFRQEVQSQFRSDNPSGLDHEVHAPSTSWAILLDGDRSGRRVGAVHR